MSPPMSIMRFCGFLSLISERCLAAWLLGCWAGQGGGADAAPIKLRCRFGFEVGERPHWMRDGRRLPLCLCMCVFWVLIAKRWHSLQELPTQYNEGYSNEHKLPVGTHTHAHTQTCIHMNFLLLMSIECAFEVCAAR